MPSPADPRTDPARLEEAVRWLHEVDGRLMRRREAPASQDGWVAIVKTPAAPGRGAQLILGFGDSALAAVATAQERWDDAWRALGAVH